jgi:hypothetical protein
MAQTIDTTRRNLDSRLDALGWGLFFLMSGGALLVPALPNGSWLVGVGALFLGLSAVRFSVGLPVSGFGVVVGVVAVVAGSSAVAGIAVPWLALALVACGLAIVTGQLTHRTRQA